MYEGGDEIAELSLHTWLTQQTAKFFALKTFVAYGIYFYLFTYKALQLKGWRYVWHQVVQPAQRY